MTDKKPKGLSNVAARSKLGNLVHTKVSMIKSYNPGEATQITDTDLMVTTQSGYLS